VVSKLEYLARMGVEVWVPRESQPKGITEDVHPPATEAPVEIPGPSPEPLYFCFLNYGNVALCCALEPGLTTIPNDVRRLCNDIAFALVGKRAAPEVLELRWPLIETGPSSIESAVALVRQNAARLPARIVMFGLRFAQYSLDVEDIEAGVLYLQGEQQILVEDDISDYIGSVERKRSLWDTINKASLNHVDDSD
jgi:hypothetical protein